MTALGFLPEFQDRIFELFFTTKQDVGTGLGLWVTRGIVDRHGGRIETHPRSAGEPARGTVFSITLPLAGELENAKSSGWSVYLGESLTGIGAYGKCATWKGQCDEERRGGKSCRARQCSVRW